jgi:hypothetical protein
MHIDPDPDTLATVVGRPSRVAQLAAPVEDLEADRMRAFFSSERLGIWSAQTGRIRPQRGDCEILVDLAIAGTRTAWICEEQGTSFCADTLKTATLARPRPVDVVRLNYCELSVAAHGSVVFYSTGRKIWRLEGGRKRLVRIEQKVARPLSVDGDRVLLERKDGSLEIVTTAGVPVRVLRFAKRVASADLAGDLVVVLEGAGVLARLQVVRLRDGKRIRSWRLPTDGAVEFQSADGMLAAYVVGIALHVINLANGHDVVLQFLQQAGETNARLVDAGLFYSHGQAYTARPGRLGFIPRRRLVELLR